MFPPRPLTLRSAVVIVSSVLALVSACGATPGGPTAPAGPTNIAVPLGPQSTVTVDVTGAISPPRISVATLSLAQGGLQFRDVRNGPVPVHQQFPFAPPPAADSMGVVVRFFGDGNQYVDCTITVDGRVVDREEHATGCSDSSDPRWTSLLWKAVVPGRYYPPDRDVTVPGPR